MSGWPVEQAAATEVAPAVVETEEQFVMRRNAEIQYWLAAKETAVSAVENERDWRGKVTKTLFPTPKKGTQRYQLTAGYAVKLVQNYTHKLGDKDKCGEDGAKIPINRQIEEVLDQIRAIGNQGELLADRLVKWAPSLDVKEYEALDTAFEDQAKIKALIDGILTIDDATPQLTFEEPKAA